MNIRSKQAVGAVALAWALFVLCVVTQAFGTSFDVHQIGLFSFAGQQSQFQLYGKEQREQFPDLRTTFGGSVAREGNYLEDPLGYRSAVVLSTLETFEDSLTWDVWTALYGERAGNAVYMSFSIYEPLDFSFSLDNDSLPRKPQLWTGGIFGQGSSGVLQAGDYLLWYLDSWNQAGGEEGVSGGFTLTLERVPDTGSTLLLLGIGLIGLLAVKRRMAVA